MYRRFALSAGGLVLLSVALLEAQETNLTKMYGSGVHAFFSNDYQKAHALFTSAIDGGTKDPRCHYFRGLTYIASGRPEAAKPDFEKGAQLETADSSNLFMVGKSLERIQGKTRSTLEQYRAKARKEAREREEKRHKARYEDIREQERRILQQQAEVAPAKPAESPAAKLPAPKPAPAAPEPAPAAPKPAPAAPKPAPAEKKATAATEPAGGVLKALHRAVSQAFIGDSKKAGILGMMLPKRGPLPEVSDDPFANEAPAPGEAKPAAGEKKPPPAKTPAKDSGDPFRT